MNRRVPAFLILFCMLTTNASAMEEHEPDYGFFQADQFEYRAQDGRDSLKWDAQGWYGGDYDKLWLKTEGEKLARGKTEKAEVQVLFSHLVTDFFDVQAGVRYDPEPHPRRGYAVLGVQGLAPYYFETDAALFLSNEGELSARFEAEYELLLSQRLVLQPSFEVNLAAQDTGGRGIGSGVNDIELGLPCATKYGANSPPISASTGSANSARPRTSRAAMARIPMFPLSSLASGSGFRNCSCRLKSEII